MSPQCPITSRSGVDAALGEERELVAAVARRRVGVGGDRHAGAPVRGRGRLHHPSYVGGEALVGR